MNAMKLLLAALTIVSSSLRTAARSLRSGNAVPNAGPGQQVLPLNFNLADCYADPTTCSGAMDSLSNLSKTILAKVMTDRNQTQQRVQQAMQNFVACTPKYTTTRRQFKSALRKAAKGHKRCRKDEVAKNKDLKRCVALKKKLAQLEATACGDSMLTTQQPSPGVCKAPTQMNTKTIGTYYKNMRKQFAAWSATYAKKYRACQKAKKQHAEMAATCKSKGDSYKSKRERCEKKLTDLEEFSCLWAQKSEDRRKTYNTCYSTAVTDYEQLKTSLAETEGASEQEYKLGMRLKCMADAVDSKGSVDMTKMRACKSISVDVSFLKVVLPPQPLKKTYWSPKIYPGSRAYWRRVYKRIGRSVRKVVRPPTLCLGWKGGCAARSTFAGAPVYLKLEGKYCDLDRSKAIRCKGGKSRFAFVGHQANCSRATLVAVNRMGKPIGDCHFAPEKQFPRVSCPRSRRNSGIAEARVEIPNNNPMVGRSNKIALKLAALKNVKMRYSGWSAWTGWNLKAEYSCTNGGALVGLNSKHDKEKEDRAWRHRCGYFPKGVGQSTRRRVFKRGERRWREKWGGWQNSWNGRLDRVCPKGEAIAGHKSKHGNKNKDRRFHFPCKQLPPGMEVKAEGSWDAWTEWESTWTKSCEEGEVLVGLESIHDNKKEDRRWRRKCSQIAALAPKLTSFDVVYVPEFR